MVGARLPAVFFFGAFVTSQVVVPAAQLAADRPARFGWQMWSGRRRPVQVFAVTRAGSRERVDLRPYLVVGRGELDVETALPPHLCQLMSGIISVEIGESAELTRAYPCR